MKDLYITEISVTKLFGKTNINGLKLFQNGMMTNIIISCNGGGKTTLFDILEFIFGSGRKLRLKDIPFDNVKLTLSNGKTVVLERRTEPIRYKLYVMNGDKLENSVVCGFEVNYDEFQDCLSKSNCCIDICHIHDDKYPISYIIDCLKNDIADYTREYTSAISMNKFLLGNCNEVSEELNNAITKTEDARKKLRWLKNVIDERNECFDKKLVYDTNDVVLFQDGDNFIDIRHWSSGEINDFIMFYCMGFMLKGNADGKLILIDTPETSLHIALQETFMKYVNELCEKNGYHALVATQSPYIVAEYAENVVSLRPGRMTMPTTR